MTTVTRSFRLEDKLLQDIAMSARKYGQTENQLVSSWLTWRVGFDLLIPAFDGLMMAAETFQSIVNTCNIDALEILASELGKKHFVMSRTIFEANGKELTFVKFVDEILSKRGQWFRIEGEIGQASSELVLQHKLGTKWSVFLKNYLSGAYESIPQGRLVAETTDTFVRLRLNRPTESTRRF